VLRGATSTISHETQVRYSEGEPAEKNVRSAKGDRGGGCESLYKKPHRRKDRGKKSRKNIWLGGAGGLRKSVQDLAKRLRRDGSDSQISTFRKKQHPPLKSKKIQRTMRPQTNSPSKKLRRSTPQTKSKKTSGLREFKLQNKAQKGTPTQGGTPMLSQRWTFAHARGYLYSQDLEAKAAAMAPREKTYGSKKNPRVARWRRQKGNMRSNSKKREISGPS